MNNSSIIKKNKDLKKVIIKKNNDNKHKSIITIKSGFFTPIVFFKKLKSFQKKKEIFYKKNINKITLLE